MPTRAPDPRALTSNQLECINRVHECVERAQQVLKCKIAIPAISFKQNGKIAGSARLQSYELRFNHVLLEDNSDLFLEEVVPHELCHLLAHKLYGRVKPHGKEWRHLMMQIFNLPGQTYHSMDVTKVQGMTFAYQCECEEVKLSIRRHNKVLRNQAQYHCRSCGNRLTRTTGG